MNSSPAELETRNRWKQPESQWSQSYWWLWESMVRKIYGVI